MKEIETKEKIVKTKIKAIPGIKPVLVAKKTKIKKDNILGLTEEMTLQTLSSPASISEDKQISVWNYENRTCNAKLYFYAGSCLYIETEFNKKEYKNTNACLNTFTL